MLDSVLTLTFQKYIFENDAQSTMLLVAWIKDQRLIFSFSFLLASTYIIASLLGNWWMIKKNKGQIWYQIRVKQICHLKEKKDND